MGSEIIIDDELYNDAKHAAEAEDCTVPLQISHWAKIGKAALENPDLPGEFIKDILAAREKKDFKSFEFSGE